MTPTIVIINGPNLNMLGTREPEFYGTQSLDDIRRMCEECAQSLSYKMDFKQSNHEGQIIDWIQEAEFGLMSGIVLNPAGLGHSSVALMDALGSVTIPAVEVHLSNIFKRERFRQHTYTSRSARGVVAGFGGYGYLLAIYAVNEIIKTASKKTA